MATVATDYLWLGVYNLVGPGLEAKYLHPISPIILTNSTWT